MNTAGTLAFAFATFALGISIGSLGAKMACSGEYRVQTITDKHGIKMGTIEQRPDDKIVIKDRHGIKTGEIETKGDRLVIRDRWGLPKGEVK